MSRDVEGCPGCLKCPALSSEIASLERQVAEERSKLLGHHRVRTRNLGGLVANDEEWVVDREFTGKVYVAALSSLERARVEPDRRQRGVAFVRLMLPEEALFRGASWPVSRASPSPWCCGRSAC
jgi:capsule polysaccharide export protein KpsE/RkpR